MSHRHDLLHLTGIQMIENRYQGDTASMRPGAIFRLGMGVPATVRMVCKMSSSHDLLHFSF